MVIFFKLLRNRNVILSRTIALDLYTGQGAVCTERLVLLVLVFVMTLSTTHVADLLFRSPCALLVPRIDGVAMNYVVIGGFVLEEPGEFMA